MSSLTINGNHVELDTEQSGTLMDYLRDQHQLKSVKDGCRAGACGTCTVIINGKAQKSCVSLASLETDEDDDDSPDHFNIITVEGLNKREQAVYDYAFAEAGAVQCGFCTPGMVLSTKALLDVNLHPSDDDIKQALKRNVCRCTGYVKIIDAVKIAAQLFRENLAIPDKALEGGLGVNVHRVDAREKTLGTGEFVDDVVVPGMLFGKALRTKHPRAKIVAIDVSKAAQHPDAVCIMTADDIPGDNKLGHLVKDWDALISVGDCTRYLGDAIALVASTQEQSLNDILSLIEVEYEVFNPICSPIEALAENAAPIHPSGNVLSEEVVKRGDAESAIANATFCVSQHYSTPFTEHAFMEPECAIAIYEDHGILLYSGGQGIYDDQHEVATVLGISDEKIRVQSKLVGGGFGGKEDVSVQHHAALLAWQTKAAVKVKFSRAESILIHPKRHAMEMDLTTACDENGILLGMKADIVLDTGAYASLGGPVLQRACTHAAGPYNFQNVDIVGKAVYTNNPPGGAFRGFGVSQSAFAFEANLNLLANKVGISAWEIRHRNAIRPGQSLPNGQIADQSTALVECLEALKEEFENAKYAGIAASFKNSGLGVGVPDIGRAILSVEKGKVHVRSSAACIGQGMATVSLQTVCEVTGLTTDNVIVEAPDTARTPNSGTTTASRQTVFTGEAIRQAALKLLQDLQQGSALADLEGNEYYGEYEGKTDPMGSDKANPVSHVAYGFAAQVVTLDDNGKVEKVTAAYDLGRVVNRKSAEGQIEGGIAMGLGYALTEDYPLVNAVPKANFKNLGLFQSLDMPNIETIIVEKQDYSEIAHGTKGVGELATIPTAPATQGAYYSFDARFRTKLPLEDTAYRKPKKIKEKRARRRKGS